jgi:hypothetical protein
METTQLDPPQVAGQAGRIEECATRLGAEVNALAATVTSGNPWGADEPGTAFGTVYTPLVGHAIEVYDSHVGQLQDAADALMTMAARMVAADQDAVRRINGAGAGV